MRIVGGDITHRIVRFPDTQSRSGINILISITVSVILLMVIGIIIRWSAYFYQLRHLENLRKKEIELNNLDPERSNTLKNHSEH